MALRKTTAARDRRHTVIGAGAVLDGALAIESDMRVDGTLRSGHLSTDGALVVGAGGVVQAGDIEVGEAHISGRVSGRLCASRRVYLAQGAEFCGALVTPKLVVEEGARLRPGKES